MVQSFVFNLDEEVERFDVWTENKVDHVGYLNYRVYEEYIEICDVLLNSEYRQKGIGSELINRVIKIAKDKKCKSVCLGTQADDFPVHKFYSKHGFELIDVKNGNASFVLTL
jgi:GNAT superfamily N-acetyltransferase